MFNKVFLTIKDAVAAMHYALPVLSSFMHPHFVLFPVGFCFERLLRLLLSAVSAEHVRFAGLIL